MDTYHLTGIVTSYSARSQSLHTQVCLQNWPAELGGGPDALCLLVDLVSQCVFLPFSQPGPVDEELLQTVQRSVLLVLPCVPQPSKLAATI